MQETAQDTDADFTWESDWTIDVEDIPGLGQKSGQFVSIFCPSSHEN